MRFFTLFFLLIPVFASGGPISDWRSPKFCATLLVGEPKYFREENQTFDERIKKAQEVGVPFFFEKIKKGNRILLYAKDESEARFVLRDLEQWRTRGGAPITDLKSEAKTLTGGGVIYDVTESIPETARFFHGRQPYDQGPNCWEFACYLTGSIHSITGGMDEEEFAFWLTTSKYKKLGATEVPQPGDLVAIRTKTVDGKIGDAHGAVYISERLMLSKNGIAFEDPYRLQSTDEVFGTYMPKLPKSCINPRFWNRPECARFVEVYRPVHLEKETPVALPAAIAESVPDLERFEKMMTDWWILEKFPTSQQEKAMADFVNAQSERAAREIGTLQSSVAENPEVRDALVQYWKIYWARVAHLAHVNPRYKLKPW